ncbi:aromatic amino acid DMT transporter YddG [Acinetobacter rongchengensis]|uniref:Aromatic amino acid efflux DMT transporter YddG n=1 Tax=Acinetobacter rongchengensis TaxID=2419601 RepID=A0A3A8EPN2_9GAMM|nr:aromatic amino acid DMT transporter YddG [Acinetobacter rongchengensis]RKG36847.1 aromatic amino acid efflux DMT transporter YddG [Acinetobacter rongchengensis]
MPYLNRLNRYTWMGLSSILIWASLVAVVKLITESLSPILAIALIYSFSALSILLLNGFPQMSRMPKSYLWGCGSLFVLYEVLFLSSVAFSHDHEQVLMIGMINYLWPPLTVVFAIFAKQLSYKLPVILGFILAVLGLMMVVNPDVLNLSKLFSVLQKNPVAYSFALIGAILWSCYSVLTKKYAQGHNAVPLFFTVTAVSLWVVHFVSAEPFSFPNFKMWAAIALTGSLIGIAYSHWNQSLQFGDMKLLILVTYFMPILSSVMSMLILDATPQLAFWIGTILVTIGAIVCWKSTAERQ